MEIEEDRVNQRIWWENGAVPNYYELRIIFYKNSISDVSFHSKMKEEIIRVPISHNGRVKRIEPYKCLKRRRGIN